MIKTRLNKSRAAALFAIYLPELSLPWVTLIKSNVFGANPVFIKTSWNLSALVIYSFLSVVKFHPHMIHPTPASLPFWNTVFNPFVCSSTHSIQITWTIKCSVVGNESYLKTYFSDSSIMGGGQCVLSFRGHDEASRCWPCVLLCVCSGRVQQAEVAAGLASVPAALLHRPQLLHTSLGQLLHAVLHCLHPVDRRLLLRHGLDGERREKKEGGGGAKWRRKPFFSAILP